MFDGLDGLKNLADKATDKAKDVAEEHGDVIETGLEKAGGLADERTDGKYSEQIDTGVSKARQLVRRLGEQGGEQGSEKPGP
ncbi:antitoxin [Streptomyces sp. NPDC054813]